jgi:hypothetical protein
MIIRHFLCFEVNLEENKLITSKLSEFGFVGFIDFWIIRRILIQKIHKSEESQFRQKLPNTFIFQSFDILIASFFYQHSSGFSLHPSDLHGSNP